ncbi:hypothetical protein [Halodesulfovibrio sp.]|jgi:DNA-binding PadR family transcriptional regulator|uniref:hypothetical protein n=1 Tax=Halodesulfovibrio sp. TaxID=1912772 RepID=UPI0025F4652B|nr:hypothetical protein [Halodesulfovibrio sp.]MCT4535108.1 hypothetical protein [Halodesulfovibrio sp.]MCT4627406.1 hypothetical protein [Halodesulfovibrio sp.]
MKPLNYAMLKYFTKVEDACVDDVMDALKSEYGHFKAFKRPSMLSAIMTAEANGLLEETRFEMGSDNELKVYYRAHEEGAATINYYIKD